MANSKRPYVARIELKKKTTAWQLYYVTEHRHGSYFWYRGAEGGAIVILSSDTRPPDGTDMSVENGHPDWQKWQDVARRKLSARTLREVERMLREEAENQQ